MKVEFRDGEREVPDYVATQMSGLDTYKMTLKEALDAVNEQNFRNVVDKHVDEIIDAHMRNLELGQ